LRTLASLCLFTLVLIAAATRVASAQSVVDQHITPTQWRSDLRYLQAYVEGRHPDPFFRTSKAEFQRAAVALDAAIPTLDNAHIIMGFQKLLAMLWDGHTTIPLQYPEAGPIRARLGFRQYPLSIEHLSDGWFVTAASQDFAPIVGGKVVSIGGVPMQRIIEKATPYTSRDNDFTAFGRLPYLLQSPEMLEGASIVRDASRATITVDVDGTTRSAQLRPTREGERVDVLMRRPDAPVPFREQNTDKFFWMAPVTNGTLYVGYNTVGNMPDQSFEDFCALLQRTIENEHPARLVIDLRRNGGGSGELNLYLLNTIARVPQLDTPKTLFVLVGPRTFSAAQMAADNFDLRTNALFIGEPTGGRPNHYGDAHLLTLPNSGVPVAVSTVFHQENGAFDNRQFTPPQVAVDVSSDDERRGIDPALNALDSYVPFATFAKDSIAALDVAGFQHAYSVYRANPQNAYVSLLGTTTRFAQSLLAAGRAADAARLVELALRDYPPQVTFIGNNAYRVLMQSYDALHEREKTIAACRRWLAYDPYDVDAVNELRRLGVQA
jgi:hypothetical protein